MTIPKLTNEQRDELRGLAEAAWKAAVEGDQLDQINHLTPEGLADDMISCDADVETFSDRYGYETTHAYLTQMLPQITGNGVQS